MSKFVMDLLTETESLERLLYRLPEKHAQRPFIEREVYRSTAGKRGEDRIERKFREFHLDENYKFLRNVSLAIGEWKVQMDGILLTERGAIIIESKNISGKLYFDDSTGEFSRIDREGIRTVMDDPIVQLSKHIRFLDQFFNDRRIKLPVKGIVVFTSKECEFQTKPKSADVCKTYQMVDYLHRIHQSFPSEVAQANLVKITKILQKYNAPYKRIPLCRQFYIEPADLRRGILCGHCKKHSISKKRRVGWICSQCNIVDPAAFQLAVQEYFSLVDTEITNSRLREFCQISSIYTVSRLLASMELEVAGSLRNRSYSLKNKNRTSR